MCYHISINTKSLALIKRFKAKFAEARSFKPIYHASAFSFPLIPVIANRDARQIRLFRWGLVPHWVRDEKTAAKMRQYTLNAKAETVFEKPAFKSAIRSKRCLVLVTGFYEWQHFRKQTYPYHITRTDHEPFAMGGIWDEWTNPQTGEIQSTFSIVTTHANELLEKIHNTRKRMPLILPKENETQWLSNDLDHDRISSLLVPFDAGKLTAHTISRLITDRAKSSNVPEVMKTFTYPELTPAFPLPSLSKRGRGS